MKNNQRNTMVMGALLWVATLWVMAGAPGCHSMDLEACKSMCGGYNRGVYRFSPQTGECTCSTHEIEPTP